jgi:hypothetical protein
MTDTTVGRPLAAGLAQPLQRCCPKHDDWPTLSQHMLVDFPELGIEEVLREVRRARDAVVQTGMTGAEALDTAELIARHQLLMLTGRIEDIARLNPERHTRRQAAQAIGD